MSDAKRLLPYVIVAVTVGAFVWGACQQPPDRLAMPEGATLVASEKSLIYHVPTCRHALKIAPRNRLWFRTPSEATANACRPCRACLPNAPADVAAAQRD